MLAGQRIPHQQDDANQDETGFAPGSTAEAVEKFNAAARELIRVGSIAWMDAARKINRAFGKKR